MSEDSIQGLIYDDEGDIESIEGFTAKCAECGSENVSVHYEFNYYGGMTGYDRIMDMRCRDCGNSYGM